MPRHLIPYLIPILLALGCQGVIDGGDDEAIADQPDGTFNLDIAYPDARVYMYGEPGSPFGEFSTIDGVVTYPLEEEYEWLPFAHSSPPLPAYPSNTLPFPYPRGVPDLDLDSPAYADRWWENYEMTRDGMMVPYDIPATAQPRSWLVAAYGFYVPTPSNPEPFFKPVDHPQPSGMVSPLWLLNPITWGAMVARMNIVGVPCNKRKPTNIDAYGPWSTSPQTTQYPHHHCADYVGGGISAVSANWYTASDAIAWSLSNATCLDGGGNGLSELTVLERVTRQIVDLEDSGRQGLVIINLDEIDEALEAVRWVLGQAGLEEIADEMLDEFESFVGENHELLHSTSFTAPYLTDSGVCAFKAELVTEPSIVDGEEQLQIVTRSGCPHGHHPVFLPFSSYALGTGQIESVGGYCAVSFSVFAAGNDPLLPGSDPNTPLAVLPPEYSVADTPTGVRKYTLNGDRMTVETLSMWASNVAFVPGHEGWMLDAVTDRLTGSTILGESVLDQFGLEVGDVVSGIDSTISLLPGREEQARSAALSVLCERDRECESSYVDTPLDVLLAAYVEQRLLEWETVTLWVHRGDMVLPTYLRLRPAQL